MIDRYYRDQILIVIAAFVLEVVTIAALAVAFPVLRVGVLGGIVMGMVGFTFYLFILMWLYDRRRDK